MLGQILWVFEPEKSFWKKKAIISCKQKIINL